MLYAFILIDRADGADLRQRLRPEHKAYVDAMGARVAFAGPFTSEDGQAKIGSLFAIDFPSRAAAQEWLAGEPYAAGGLFASVTVLPWLNLWKPPA